MRSFRLARIALEAELLRVRRLARRTVVRVALALVALPFLLATFGFLEAAFWSYVSQHFIPSSAALIVAGGNLLVGLILVLIAAVLSDSRVEIEALKVRQQALEDVGRQLTIAALVAPVARLLVDQMRRKR